MLGCADTLAPRHPLEGAPNEQASDHPRAGSTRVGGIGVGEAVAAGVGVATDIEVDETVEVAAIGVVGAAVLVAGEVGLAVAGTTVAGSGGGAVPPQLLPRKMPATAAANAVPAIMGAATAPITIQAQGPQVAFNQAPPVITMNAPITINMSAADPGAVGAAVSAHLNSVARRALHDGVRE